MCVSSTLTYPATPQNDPDPQLKPVTFPEYPTILRTHRNGTEAYSDVSSVVVRLQPVDDPYWTGVTPLPFHSVAATLEVSVNSTHWKVVY